MTGSGPEPAPAVAGLPRTLLRIEGATLLAGAVVAYARGGWSWVLFAVLLLAPDLGMLGYLAGPRVGAVAYDLMHTYPAPAVLAAVALWSGSGVAAAVAVVWFAHIGMDRVAGYGLKYPTRFEDTHLGRIGRRG